MKKNKNKNASTDDKNAEVQASSGNTQSQNSGSQSSGIATQSTQMNQKKRRPKRKKLLFQVGGVLFLIFTIVILISAFTTFFQGTSMFLKSKDDMIKPDLENLTNKLLEYKAINWYMDYWAENPDSMKTFFNDESVYIDTKLNDFNWEEEIKNYTEEDIELLKEPERSALAKYVYYLVSREFYNDTLLQRYINVFCYDITDKESFRYIYFSGNDCKELVDDFKFKNIPLGTDIKMDDETLENFYNEDLFEDNLYAQIGIYDKKDSYNAYIKTTLDNGRVILVGCSYDLNEIYAPLFENVILLIAFSFLGFVIAGALVIIFVYIMSIRPLNKIKVILQEYIKTKDSQTANAKLSKIKTRNEFGVLADDISDMTLAIDRYTEENVKLAKEKERTAAELDVAATIQRGVLPSVYPELDGYKLCASMDPAKEVGGDFYDFFLIDEDHLCLVIADVSGKGIPASLFMMISKTFVKNSSVSNTDPADILTKTNEGICETDNDNMFVTVWIGVINLKTGHVNAANAGHEYPMIKKANGQFELFKDKHSVAIGIMDGMRFKSYEFDLEPGDSIFVYTDGAAEATNANDELFGTDRMLESLNTCESDNPDKLLDKMTKDIDKFVGTAPQFDDLTMLSIHRYS
ncbi:MAG: PP2C family protein-serine/threonine phosphatase [Lachnospiraceae bacterium]|nr:PP2C family protein-serine/threonine phosphatase [Lachnospiraceae bacterium]